MKLGLGILLLAGVAVRASALDIAAQNAWSFSLGRGALAAGAGSNIAQPVDSGSMLLTIDVTNSGGAAWVVKARRSDLQWASGAGLSVRRVSDGSGTGSITGGNAYVGVNGSDQTVFSGSGDRTGIRVQLRLDGASIAIAPGNYGTTVVYTVQ
jgi:hypothetical protein